VNGAARQFLRIVAHWPQLGGDDELAEQRAVDWLGVIARYDDDVAARVTDALIAGWVSRWHPNIGDWRVIARAVAIHERSTVPELEGGTIDRARLDALLAETSEKLTMERAAARVATRAKRGDVRLDPTRHMPSYDDVYGNPTQEDDDQ